jgi:hypothetical protein
MPTGSIHSPPSLDFFFFLPFLAVAVRPPRLLVDLRAGAGSGSEYSSLPKSNSSSSAASIAFRTNGSLHLGQGAFFPIMLGFLIRNCESQFGH